MSGVEVEASGRGAHRRREEYGRSHDMVIPRLVVERSQAGYMVRRACFGSVGGSREISDDIDVTAKSNKPVQASE